MLQSQVQDIYVVAFLMFSWSANWSPPLGELIQTDQQGYHKWGEGRTFCAVTCVLAQSLGKDNVAFVSIVLDRFSLHIIGVSWSGIACKLVWVSICQK